MRILAVSDEVVEGLYNVEGLRRRCRDVDLILSAGDLPAYYLEFLVTVLGVPLFYVRGNHLWEFGREGSRPGGCEDIDGRVVRNRGLLIAGLEGSMRYSYGDAQYTDMEMWGKALQLAPKLYLNKYRYGRALDILLTHAPPYGIHDRQDVAHTGFRAFLRLMEWFKPRYLLHGHIHIYDRREPTSTTYMSTQVVNVYPYKLLDVVP